jgi:murein DD-endopeptidase MepM/ murein hydrolase activator NlpD
LKTSASRLATYLVVGTLAVAALQLDPPDAPSPTPLAAIAARESTSVAVPRWRQRVDTLGRGETLSHLLARGGVTEAEAADALGAARGLNERRVPAGMPVVVRSAADGAAPAEIILHLAVDRSLHLRRTDSGWTSDEVRLPWTTDTMVVGGVIRSSLYEALDSAAAALPRPLRGELAWRLADIFEYRVDMSRELQPGDSFRVLFVRAQGPRGVVRVGDVLAARFELSGSPLEAVRYRSRAAGGEYFDQEGKSLRNSFLRAPLSFRRISSVYGMRRHPILGVWRQHKGTDYAAGSGTPVRSVGDGMVVFAGRRGGYGNTIEVRHRNGYVTRYGHLRGFARSVRRGGRVAIGQTIGYVGSTGLSTAPHLHFEVLVNGVHRDPRVALNIRGGDPIARAEHGAFESARSALLAALDREGGAGRVAMDSAATSRALE